MLCFSPHPPLIAQTAVHVNSHLPKPLGALEPAVNIYGSLPADTSIQQCWVLWGLQGSTVSLSIRNHMLSHHSFFTPSLLPFGTLGQLWNGAGTALTVRTGAYSNVEGRGRGHGERCSLVLGRAARRTSEHSSSEGRGKHWQLQITNQCRVTTTAANNEGLISLLWQ